MYTEEKQEGRVRMYFIDEKIRVNCETLAGLVKKSNTPISDVRFIKAPYKTTNTPPAQSADWKPYHGEDMCADIDEHFWFAFEIDVPKAECGIEYRLEGHASREGEWDAKNPQCTVYIDNESAYQAFDTNHTDTPVAEGHHKVFVYYYTGMIPGDNRISFSLSEVDLEVEALYYDINVPYLAMKCLAVDSDDYNTIHKALDRATQIIDYRYPRSEGFYRSVGECREFMKREFYEKSCGKSNSTLGVIGHTHIDVAWLWTLAQTREKAQRSFSTVIRLMEKYPEYVFMSSQPQLFAYLKEVDSELFEKIKQKVKEGRFEMEGAMWLEADTNLSSGESLIRQILFGKKFMREEFGVENEMLWLPDVFGYSGALPQILKKSGVDKFYTAKLNWNETNKPQHDLFVWKGIDGSEVFAHLNDTYVKKLDPDVVLNSWKLHKDKRYSDIHTMTFGFGDGGGGPTAKMIEHYRRMKDGLPGFPKLVMQKAKTTILESEKNFRENCEALKFTPKWIGELYFERHRGTYTTQANNKKNNRKSELALARAEALAIIDNLFFGTEYPKEELGEAWIKVLRNQFHDIIPGSSIASVYRDSDREYKEVLDTANTVFESAVARIAKNLKTDGGVFVYNSSPFEYSGVIETDDGARYVNGIPAHGYKVVNPKAENTVSAKGRVIENELVRVEFDEKFEISSIYDKRASREVVAEGERANVLEVFEDKPFNYDAWEISEYYQQKKWTVDTLVGVSVINEGARAGFRIEKKYGNSHFVQTVTLSHGSARLDFDTEIDWHEEHSLLKAAFPTSIVSPRATYEIQFGHLDRPTHRNTPVDEAKFEVCAHKWADLSEPSFGVSLLNNAKYGYSCDEGKLSLSLLRSPKYPDPNADIGKHKFTYSIFTHLGYVGIDTIREGYLLNCPPTLIKTEKANGEVADSFCLVKPRTDGFVVETVKAAEDGDGFIVRGYEALGNREDVALSFGVPVASAALAGLMEDTLSALEVCDNTVKFTAKPFEIVTLRIK